MNKYCIDGVLVVEGKSDVSYLSSFINTNYFITNGYDISEEKLEFLELVSKVNKVIILTDNDEAGLQISDKIKSRICGVFVVKTAKLTRKNYKKSGVAETKKEEIIKVLEPFFTKLFNKVNYYLTSIISLSKNPEEKRKQIVNEYRLIEGNNKFLEEQLNMLKVDTISFKHKYGIQ